MVLISILATAITTFAFPQPVHAATPPLLKITTVDGDLSEHLEELGSLARSLPTPPKQQLIRVVNWALSIHDDGGDVSSEVKPRRYLITRNPDGSIAIEFREFDTNEEPVVLTENYAVLLQGTQTAIEHFSATDTLFRGDLPSDVNGIRSYLAQAFTTGSVPSTYDYFTLIVDLNMEMQLSGSQQSALLDFLSNQPGVTLVGTVVDRLGREGIVLTHNGASSYDTFQYLVFSTKTGELIAAETIYIGEKRTDIPSPSVISYYIWERISQ